MYVCVGVCGCVWVCGGLFEALLFYSVTAYQLALNRPLIATDHGFKKFSNFPSHFVDLYNRLVLLGVA